MGFFSTDAFALIASSLITAAVTVFVTVYTLRRSARPAVKRQAGEDVYKAWIKELRNDIKALNDRVDELERDLEQSNQLSKRRLDKLLDFSRRYNVDIRDVI